MNLECAHVGGQMEVSARLTSADLPKLDVIFAAIRDLLEIEVPRACAPFPVEGPAGSIGDVPGGREAANSGTDAATEYIAQDQ